MTTISYAYDDAGRMTTATLPSGTDIVSTYTYDNADRLTGISHVKGGSTTIASVAYTLDAVGNRTQRVDQQGTHTYVYDDLHRLTSVTYPGPSTTTYDFDAFGNRTEMVNGAGTTTYAYDDADRLTTVTPPSPASAVSYTWDDNGNLTDRGSDDFAWDYEDRMTSATVNSVTTTFAYRGDGLRDSRTTGMTTTTFTWDIASGLPVVLDDGNQYVYGAGLASMKQGGNWYYYLADGLGSTMAVVDSAGAVQKSYQYDVYGEVTGGSGSLGNEFDFAGQQTDGTGLQYLRARYYDPETGTFLSREPFSVDPSWLGNPSGYAAANPARYVDPRGTMLEENGENIGGSYCYSTQCAFVHYDGDYSGGGGIDWVSIWNRVRAAACDLRPGCELTLIVPVPNLLGEYADLDMTRKAYESFRARPWTRDEMADLIARGQHFTDERGHDVWLGQDANGNYKWLVMDDNGKIWSLRKGQTEEALETAQRLEKWN